MLFNPSFVAIAVLYFATSSAAPFSFPGKLTQVLYHRYKAGKKGIIMLACELIDNNGKELLKCVNQYIE